MTVVSRQGRSLEQEARRRSRSFALQPATRIRPIPESPLGSGRQWFELLQRHHVRLRRVQPSEQYRQALVDVIDVPSRNLQGCRISCAGPLSAPRTGRGTLRRFSRPTGHAVQRSRSAIDDFDVDQDVREMVVRIAHAQPIVGCDSRATRGREARTGGMTLLGGGGWSASPTTEPVPEMQVRVGIACTTC